MILFFFSLAVSRSGDSEVHSTPPDPRQEERPREERRIGWGEGGPRGPGWRPAAVSQHQRADGAHPHAHHSACHVSHRIASSPAGTQPCRLLLLSLLVHLAAGIPCFASPSPSPAAAPFTCKGRRVSDRGAGSVGQEDGEEECCGRGPPLSAGPIYPSLLRQQSAGQRPKKAEEDPRV